MMLRIPTRKFSSLSGLRIRRVIVIQRQKPCLLTYRTDIS